MIIRIRVILEVHGCVRISILKPSGYFVFSNSKALYCYPYGMRTSQSQTFCTQLNKILNSFSDSGNNGKLFGSFAVLHVAVDPFNKSRSYFWTRSGSPKCRTRNVFRDGRTNYEIPNKFTFGVRKMLSSLKIICKTCFCRQPDISSFANNSIWN